MHVGEAQGARGFPGNAPQNLVDRQAEQRRRHVHGQQQGDERRGAGIAVGRDRHAHPVTAEGRHRRRLTLPQHIEGARQQHGDRAGSPHRRGSGLIRIFQMIGGERAMSRGERGATAIAQLIGMQLHRQAEGAGGIEDPVDLLGREGDSFAEPVDCISEACRRDGREHRGADLVDEGIAIARRLGRQGMGAEKGRDESRIARASPRLRATRSSLASPARSRP